MNESTKCNHYANILMNNSWDELETISKDNPVPVAFMLAGAICYAENRTGFECPSEAQTKLITSIIDALQEHQSLEWTVMPPTPEKMLAMVAITRYREYVIPELGGNQTPYTVPVILSPKITLKARIYAAFHGFRSRFQR